MSELELFAAQLEKARDGQYRDVFEVVDDYGRIAGERAINAIREAGGSSAYLTDEGYINADLESRLWQLVGVLVRFRHSDKINPRAVYPYTSNAVVVENFLCKHPRKRESWIVLAWLQEAFPEPQEPKQLRGIKWMFTKNKIKQDRMNQFAQGTVTKIPSLAQNKTADSIVSELDADAPLRQGKTILPEDAELDAEIHRYVFQLLLAGQYKQAMDICDRTGNFHLKLAIRGHVQFIEGDIDVDAVGVDKSEKPLAGISRQPLWRRMCFQLAQEKSISSYERGIFGLLGNDVASTIVLGKSWEEQLACLLYHVVTSDEEKCLVQEGRIPKDVLDIPASQHQYSSTGKALDVLYSSSNPVIQSQSRNVIRQLMGAVINDTVDSLVSQMAQELNRVAHSGGSSVFDSRPYLLRIMTHLALFLHQLGSDRVDADDTGFSNIVYSYTEFLTQQGKLDLVPLYLSFLPAQTAVHVYSFLLANLTSQADRTKHLALARKYRIDMPSCIRAAVGRVFEESENEYLDTSNQTPSQVRQVTDTDTRILRTVEWYVDAGMWADSIMSSVSLLRRFLLSGRALAAKVYGNRVSASTILKKFDGQLAARSVLSADTADSSPVTPGARVELVEYERLVTYMDHIEAWDHHYAEATTQSRSREWQAAGLQMLTGLIDEAYELASTWMMASIGIYDAKSEEGKVVSHLRTLYVPYIILELIRVLVDARTVHHKFLKQAVEVSILVAAEDKQLYQLFVDSNSLGLLNQRLADAFTEGVDQGEAGVYDSYLDGQ